MYLCRSGHIWNLRFNSIFGEITCGLLSCFCFEQRGKVVFAFTENNFLSWKKQLLLANSNRVLDVKLLRRSRHAFLTVTNRSIKQKKLFSHVFRCSEFIQLPHSRMSWHELSIGQMFLSAHGCLKTTGIIRF